MLEIIVRPYQSPLNLSRQAIEKIISTSGDVVANPVLEWGDAGTVPAGVQQPIPTDGGGFKVVCCNDSFTQKDRKPEKVRVENPDDPNQYVMVERDTQVKFKKDWSECDQGQKDAITIGPVPNVFTASGNPVLQGTANGSADKNCDQTFKLNWDQASA